MFSTTIGSDGQISNLSISAHLPKKIEMASSLQISILNYAGGTATGVIVGATAALLLIFLAIGFKCCHYVSSDALFHISHTNQTAKHVIH